MSAEDVTEESWAPRRPPFPIFPIVCPLMFPIGLMIVIGRMRARRRGALEARLAEVEERLGDLEEKMSSD